MLLASRILCTQCYQGWKSIVLPASVEDKWLQLPSLFQAAYSSSHAIAKKANELETASHIATLYTSMKKRGEQADLDKAVSIAGSTEPN